MTTLTLGNHATKLIAYLHAKVNSLSDFTYSNAGRFSIKPNADTIITIKKEEILINRTNIGLDTDQCLAVYTAFNAKRIAFSSVSKREVASQSLLDSLEID